MLELLTFCRLVVIDWRHFALGEGHESLKVRNTILHFETEVSPEGPCAHVLDDWSPVHGASGKHKHVRPGWRT
jgi:hypothetical protein